MPRVRTILGVLLVLATVFGIPVLAAVSTRWLGGRPQVAGWLAMMLMGLLAFLAARQIRAGGDLGDKLKRARASLFPPPAE